MLLFLAAAAAAALPDLQQWLQEVVVVSDGRSIALSRDVALLMVAAVAAAAPSSGPLVE